MRLLHTSDWHLGRSFHQVGLLPAQELYLDHLVDVVRSEGVDAVLVAGDVYDRAQPAPQTVALFSEALERLTDAGAQVVITSGNHDSAVRLGFAGRLLERSGVHLRTTVADLARPVQLDGVRVYGLPYLEPAVVSEALATEDRTHAGVIRAALAKVAADVEGYDGRTVVLAHAFVSGGVTSESERDISVGGVSAVPLEIFREADYAALGHLHGAQTLEETIRYSGSPVAMSFSEAHHTKASWLVDLSGPGPARVESVTAPVHTPLALVRGTLDDILRDVRLTDAESAYCQVTLTDASRPLGAIDKVRARFPNTLSLLFDPQGAGAQQERTYERVRTTVSDAEICHDFLEHVRGGAGADQRERALIDEAIAGARLQREEARP